jgi:ubiquinone/menaquinone biosynthesis C-methylase UbiE/ADP-ribose pyrophosphatase YjhB (NUDIX family)
MNFPAPVTGQTGDAIAPELSSLLSRVYGTTAQRTIDLINRYAELYDLPSFEKEWSVDPQFLAHCAEAVNFVVVALYNSKREFFLVYSSSRLSATEPVGWRLLGGPIQDYKGESIEEAVNRIVKSEVGLEVAELEPIAKVRQTFRGSGNTIEHCGLAFIARAIGDLNVSRETTAVGWADRWKEFKFAATPPDQMAFLNREVFTVAIDRLTTKYFDPPLEEVEGARRPIFLRILHRFAFKPIMYWFGSKPLKRKVKDYIPGCNSVLDVSAGDDELVLEIAKNTCPGLCVANDIAWRQMAPLRAAARARALNVLFTNHNIAEIPFKKQFDVVVFKNSLHHARTKDELLAILARLKAISKRLLVVDIEDPKRSRLSWIVHLYYTRIYGDAGEHFFSQDQFRSLIQLVFTNAIKVTFDRVKTLKGTYMIAAVDLPESEDANSLGA